MQFGTFLRKRSGMKRKKAEGSEEDHYDSFVIEDLKEEE